MLYAEIIKENIDTKSYVVVFGGRFQPPTPGHYSIYKWLLKYFDNDKIFITTSSKVDTDKIEKYKKQKEKYLNLLKKDKKLISNIKKPEIPEIKSIFSFEEKRYLWNKLFGISESKILYSKSPVFQPVELLEKLPENTVFITVTSKKDKDRFSNSNYFEPYPLKNNIPVNFEEVKDQLKSYKEKGYYLILPELEGISATKVRNIFLSDIPENQKMQLIKNIYGAKFSKEIFDIIKNKLSVIEEIEKENNK